MELLDAKINLEQLNQQLQEAKLPITGTARLFRRKVGDEWVSSEPYILVKGEFAPAQEQAIRDVVAAHVPKPSEPTAQDKARERLRQLKEQPAISQSELLEGFKIIAELLT